MIVVRPGELEHEARLERPLPDDAADGAGSGSFDLVDTIWVSIRDQLPSRAAETDAFRPTVRRSRVRAFWRDDVLTGMRLVVGSRIMVVAGPPAELGRRGGIEMLVDEHLPAGNPA